MQDKRLSVEYITACKAYVVMTMTMTVMAMTMMETDCPAPRGHSMMNCPDGLLLIIELHTRSVLISVTDSNGSGSVSSTGAALLVWVSVMLAYDNNR